MDRQLIAAMEDKIKKDYTNIAGIAVMKDGAMQYEKYFHSCTADSRIHIFSVTKSIVSILTGIAVDKGYIKSVDQRVLDFFPDYKVKWGEKAIHNIRLSHLLTMTAPYKYRFNPYTRYFTSEDWVKFSLDLLGGKGSIGDFRYAPLIGPDILTGILAGAAGRSVFDFADTYLFTPLGIHVKESIHFNTKEEQMAFYQATDISGWVADGKGVHAAGWGLTLSPVDMVKIGQLYLNNGVWNGEQIVSKQWVDESTAEHSCWKKEGLSYGYLWWIIDPCEGSYAAVGDGGNIIYVNTKKRLAVSVASLFVPRVKDRIDFMKEFVEPAFTV